MAGLIHNRSSVMISAVMAILFLSCCNYEKTEDTNHDKKGFQTANVVFYDSLGHKNIEIMVEIAESEYEQAKGLMFREDLTENSGMLFVYKEEKIRTFWMKNTPLTLDIIFLDKDFNIINIHTWTTPFSEQIYPSESPAQYVLEVNGGFTERYQILPGHKIVWQRH